MSSRGAYGKGYGKGHDNGYREGFQAGKSAKGGDIWAALICGVLSGVFGFWFGNSSK